MSVINTNYLSMVAQNNLQKSQSALGTAIERLSSGLRINSAKDDAAGQAIANRMNAQVQGLNQAARNANDGISAAQTTEGALNQINDNLNRIRVLTVQAENGTNNDNDLTSIQNEINERLTEINRISEETSFNGKKVLATGQSLSIQVGANDNEKITINMVKINQTELSLDGFNVNNKGTVDNRAARVDDLKLASNVRIDTTPPTGTEYFLQEENKVAAASDVLSRLTNGQTVALQADGGDVAVTDAKDLGLASGTITGTLTADGSGNFKTDVNVFAEADAVALIKGTADGPTKATYTHVTGSQEILIASDGNITDKDGNQMYVTASNELSLNNSGTAVLATATVLAGKIADDTGAAGSLKLAIDGGPEIWSDGTANQVTLKGVSFTAAQLTTLAADNGNEIEVSAVQINASNAVIRADGEVQAKTGNAAAYLDQDGALVTDEFTETELFVRDNDNVTDVDANQYFVGQDGKLTKDSQTVGARTPDPLALLDQAIAKVDGFRSNLGAIQNRFESAIENLTTTATNLAAAQSRVQDADYAVEVANMTRAQILQQAGTSVLAQANQIPQGVLSLLR